MEILDLKNINKFAQKDIIANINSQKFKINFINGKSIQIGRDIKTTIYVNSNNGTQIRFVIIDKNENCV